MKVEKNQRDIEEKVRQYSMWLKVTFKMVYHTSIKWKKAAVFFVIENTAASLYIYLEVGIVG